MGKSAATRKPAVAQVPWIVEGRGAHSTHLGGHRWRRCTQMVLRPNERLRPLIICVICGLFLSAHYSAFGDAAGRLTRASASRRSAAFSTFPDPVRGSSASLITNTWRGTL